MGGERLGQRVPVAQEPGLLLLGALALGGGRAGARAVRVERRVAERPADLGQALLERVDLALDLLQPPPELAHLGRRAARAGRRGPAPGGRPGPAAAGGGPAPARVSAAR